NTELKRADSLKTQFLSLISHELRTPITPMITQIQMILKGFFGDVTDEQRESLELILRSTQRLDRLIENILDISKMEAGVMKFAKSTADLNALTEDAIEIIMPRALDKNIELTLKQDRIPPIALDKDRITQVLINLLSNAIKFTDAGGNIAVELYDKKDHALIRVRDDGIGITEEDCKRIFRPFEQVDSSMTRAYEGSGLGLAISKGIVEYHGGQIWVESEIGKGSTFNVSIPYNVEEGPTKIDLLAA
ncbi:MAG: sensor histidine kinase, partial [Candidatus Syntropharchaeales archaeon]